MFGDRPSKLMTTRMTLLVVNKRDIMVRYNLFGRIWLAKRIIPSSPIKFNIWQTFRWWVKQMRGREKKMRLRERSMPNLKQQFTWSSQEMVLRRLIYDWPCGSYVHKSKLGSHVGALTLKGIDETTKCELLKEPTARIRIVYSNNKVWRLLYFRYFNISEC